MGGEKTSTSNNQQTQYTPTPEEREYNRLMLENFKAAQPGQQALQGNALGLGNKLLQGQDLPGYLKGLPGGISEDVTNSITKQTLADIYPQFQSSGILDSGTAAQISSRTAADVRNQSAQFNIQNLSQLLNLALGGQAQIQQPINQQSSMLGNQLAGLRTMNTSGNSTTIGMNPFLKSFQTSLGSGLGSGVAGGFGGGIGKIGGGGVGAGSPSGGGGLSFGNYGATSLMCWVASEIFGGWSVPETINTRFYMIFLAPKWFRNLYLKYGKIIARFISNKPLLKKVLKPLFISLSNRGKERLNGRYK